MKSKFFDENIIQIKLLDKKADREQNWTIT